VQQNKTDVEISVRDHGIGIPVDDLERIFDKFYRVQRQKSIAGTGLGLSICKGIIEAHGGRIWASNNSDDGMSITFTLPKPKEGTQ
jgi:two-component system sensor histidine kinase KdpD